MNVLLVFAHPSPDSLNGALRDVAVTELRNEGHQVKVSDLYAMGWKSAIDQADFPGWDDSERFSLRMASKDAFAKKSLTADVAGEQEKLIWADALILQFPFWWFSMPAILKGWVERVYSFGFAFGVGEYSDKRWGDRYGEGIFAGKRAMLIVTMGGWEQHYNDRGINGPIDDLLFPINHGILYYPGFDVLPPFLVYQADRMDEARFEQTSEQLRGRMKALWTTRPIAYRQQNSGEYLIPSMQLRPELGLSSSRGFALHIKDDGSD